MNATETQETLSTADIANQTADNSADASRPLSTGAIAAAANENGNREADNGSAPLFPDNELQGFRSQWNDAQGSFVDDPRKAVQQADSLVANVVKRLAEQFADERAKLEKQWDSGDNVSTEDLRQALRRYRAFFDRLLHL